MALFCEPANRHVPFPPALVRKVTSVEDEDKEDCAPVPTFQSAFTEALGTADWTGNGVKPEGQGEVFGLFAVLFPLVIY